MASDAGVAEYLAAVGSLKESGETIIVAILLKGDDFAAAMLAFDTHRMLTREYVYIWDGFYDISFLSAALGPRQALLAGMLSWSVTSQTAPGV